MNRTHTIRQRGLSLVEHLSVLAVASVTLGATVPSVDHVLERHRLESSVAQLRTDIQHARSLAVARSRTVRLGFWSDASGSCYVIHTGKPQDCSCTAGAAPVCAAGAQALASQVFPATAALSVQSNSSSIGFDGFNGTVTPTATISVENRLGKVVHVVINIMGRARTCTTTPPMQGQPLC